MSQPLIYKNDIIQCPECKLDLYQVQRDLYKGDLVKVEDFNIVHNWMPKLQPGMRTCCGECRTSWLKNGHVHLKRYGWTNEI